METHSYFILIITWSLAYSCGQQQNQRDEKIQANRRQFRQPCGCGSAMRGASPDEAQAGLNSKPMDAAIEQVLALHRRGSRYGQRFRIKHTKY
jgi:hypothetical protein